MGKSFNSDYHITIIKIISILFISILYSIIGILIAYTTDNYVFDSYKISVNPIEMDKLSLFMIIAQTTIIIGSLSVLSYIGRNIVELIPFPLNGYDNFDYFRVKEVASGALLTVIIFTFSATLLKKYTQIKYKLNIVV
jgi:hypothetical protein